MGATPVSVLVFNAGSSSVKFGLYRVLAGMAEPVFHEAVEFTGPAGQPLQQGPDILGHIQGLLAQYQSEPDIVAHRIVHGGPHVRSHCLIDARVLKQLDAASFFAPLHNTAALDLVRLAQQHFPHAKQAACLDTAFHASLPAEARTLPVTRKLQLEGVERYGFHGISCESIIRQLGEQVPERLVIAHLGNGASITAASKGRSVDTSMGLTPTGGIMMGTRSGDIDPGLLVYLMREKRYDADRLDEMLNRRAGMLGVSLLSGDMRELRRAESSDRNAALAIRMFCYSVRKQIAAMAAVLEGIDMLIFTGGIGEHDELTRRQICEGLGWLIQNSDIKVIPTLEEEQIALHAFDLAEQAAGK